MPISRKLLNDGEHVVVSTRTHVKALIVPLLLLILVAMVAGFLSLIPAGKAQPLVQVVVWGAAALAIARLVLRPFLGWLTTTYTVTNRRLITRTGIVTRRGHDIPLIRISDVAYEHGLVDRLLGCGTLVVSDASEHGRVLLHDIPHVERVHLLISEQLHTSTGSGRSDWPRNDWSRTDDGS